jgi:glycosyltransferase involved in cell wall biosynthesis
MEIQPIAPVIVFAYNRPDALRQTISALKTNTLSEDTAVHIFSDGAKPGRSAEAVQAVRDYAHTLSGFKSVTVHASPVNKGLARSVIEGVSSVIGDSGRVIVLEDDLITSTNFLVYMNKALDTYASDPRVFSVAGFSYPMPHLGARDVYFTHRASSWGWATWKDRWADVDWAVSDYEAFKKDSVRKRQFNRMGSDMAQMLDRQMKGEIDSWAIRWCYHQFLRQTYTVYPGVSKVRNIGIEDGATHTRDRAGRFDTTLDVSGTADFNFGPPSLDASSLRAFTRHYSIRTRLKYKILNRLLK